MSLPIRFELFSSLKDSFVKQNLIPSLFQKKLCQKFLVVKPVSSDAVNEMNCPNRIDWFLKVGINSIHDGRATGIKLIQMKGNRLATKCSLRDVQSCLKTRCSSVDHSAISHVRHRQKRVEHSYHYN